MTHLRIELNTITENVTSNVIHKLYETAKTIIDAEEANEVEESLVSLKGNLLVSKAYGDEIDWLETKFPDLHITAGARYIRFADSEVLRVLLANNIGDGTGVTEADASAVTYIDGLFFGNTTVTSFNELRYFTGGVLLLSGAFLNTSNLQSIDLSTVSFLSERCFRSSGITGVINLPNITSMQPLVFDNCENITEINFGPLLTSMANSTCSGCSNLQKVTGLSNKTTVPDGMFSNCLKLSNIDINFSKVTNIGGAAFQNCKLLTNLDLSDVVSIGNVAFNGCTGLTTVDISSCTSIGESSFLNCTSLVISNLNVPNLTALGVAAFKGTKIGQVSNLGTITKIDREVFKDCTTLTSVVLPSTVTELSNNSFSGCSSLSSINLDNIEYIRGYGGMSEVYTFYGCSSLTTVSLPKCTKLDLYSTFDNCTNLKLLVAPNVTDIGRGTGSFVNCTSLKGIFLPKLSINNMLGSNYWAPGFLSYGMSNIVVLDIGNVGMMSKYTVSNYPTLRAFIIRNTTAIPTLDDSTDSAFSNVTFFVDDNLLSTYQLDSNWANVQLDVISNLNLSNYLDSDLLQIYNSCITASLSQN